jgi:hypothetical protein
LHYDEVKIWMTTNGPVWFEDEAPGRLEMQPLTGSYYFASATSQNRTASAVPIPDESDSYGIWHVLSGSYNNHTFSYAAYTIKIGYEYSDPIFSFVLDLA